MYFARSEGFWAHIQTPHVASLILLVFVFFLFSFRFVFLPLGACGFLAVTFGTWLQFVRERRLKNRPALPACTSAHVNHVCLRTHNSWWRHNNSHYTYDRRRWRTPTASSAASLEADGILCIAVGFFWAQGQRPGSHGGRHLECAIFGLFRDSWLGGALWCSC